MRARIRGAFGRAGRSRLVRPVRRRRRTARAGRIDGQAPAQTAVPPGSTLQLSLDDAVKRALENNADIAVERYNPEIERPDRQLTEGYYDPFLYIDLSKTLDRHQAGSERLHRRRQAVNTKTGPVELRREPAGATPAATCASTSTTTRATRTTRLQHLQPHLQLQPHRSASTSRCSQNFKIDATRQPAPPRQEDPRDLGRAVPADGHQHRGHREAASTTSSSTRSTTSRRPSKSLALAKKLLDENEIRVKVGHHGPARRGERAVGGGEPRGGRDRGRQRPAPRPRTT